MMLEIYKIKLKINYKKTTPHSYIFNILTYLIQKTHNKYGLI